MHNRGLPLILLSFASLSSGQVWTRYYGLRTASNEINSVVCDSSGNAYIAGFNYDSLDVIDTILTSRGMSDCYLMKIDSGGARRLTLGFGGPGIDAIAGITVKKNQSFVVTGTFQQSVVIGSKELVSPAVESFFIAEFLENGTLAWSATTNAYSGIALSCNGPGQVAVAGHYLQPASFIPGDSLPLHGEPGSRDIFVALYQPNGEILWARDFGSGTDDQVASICAIGDNRFMLAGRFKDSLHIGGDSTINTGYQGEQSFFADIDTSGNVLRTDVLAASGEAILRAITVDKDGNLYAAGRFSGELQIGDSAIVSKDEYSFFLLKMIPDHTIQWIRSVSLADGNDLDIGKEGDLFVTGNFKRETTFGTIQVKAHDIEDVFIAKYTPQGVCSWVLTAGGCRSSFGRKLAVSGTHLFVTGTGDNELVSRSCSIQFDDTSIVFNTTDYGRTFVSIVNHTITEAARMPRTDSRPFPAASVKDPKIYDLFGRVVPGTYPGYNETSRALPSRLALPAQVYLRKFDGRFHGWAPVR